MVQYLSIEILFYYGTDFIQYQYLYIDIWLLSIFYATNCSKPGYKLSVESPITKLVSFPILSSVIGMIFIHFVF